ncbi:hypothetical protein [Rhodopseudomonas palustris]|uniref:Uncharacterized protein n=1 Tax=Rhodopseudomonas palustris (strain BisB18) TaxID=316056 RepID=Q216B9_RHOPB
MSAIAAVNSSASSAVASLLSDAASAGTAGGTSAATATKSDQAASSAGGNPAVRIDLSDRAKTILERNKVEQVVAGRLQALVQTLRAQNGGKAASQVSNASSQDQSPTSSAGATPRTTAITFGSDQALSDHFQSLTDAQRQPDGSLPSFTKTESDVLNVPSTGEWYKTVGQGYIEAAAAFNDPSYNAFAQAIQNRQVTVQNAQDIAELNFHNTWTIQGGEGGVSINGASSYNHDAAIFKDPTTNYVVSGSGTVISWPKANAAS